MREGVPYEEGKRRLPLWITEVVAADHTGKDRRENKTESRLEDGALLQAKLRCHRKGAISHKDTSTEDLSLPAKLGRKRRKNQSSQPNPHCDNIVTDVVPRKKTRNIRRKVQESGRENLDLGCNDAYEPSSDGEGELTVQDLISIAEEYVKANESIFGQRKQADRESTRAPLSTAISAVDATEGSHNPPDTLGKLNYQITVSGDSTESLTEKDIVCSTISRTGDPAQDMLGVFLGPLLNKPRKEKQIDFSIKEPAFDCEMEKKSQSDCVEELLPPTRKKISLKEKVAVFFE